jgi:hypothetical protein
LKAGFEATTLEAPQKLKGLAKSYLLIKDQDDEVERFKGEDSGNKDEQEPSAGEENTVRAPVNNIDLVVAIHAAEARQAEIDAQQYGAFLLKVKEEHQQELNEAREQQEKHAEYASRLEKVHCSVLPLWQTYLLFLASRHYLKRKKKEFIGLQIEYDKSDFNT